MMINMKYAGIDGCRAGWVAVTIDGEGNPESTVYNAMEDCWEALRDAQCVLVDMPVGLPWREQPFREADRVARSMLGKRRSSIFNCPVRDAVYAGSYEEAAAITRDQTGKGLSKQSWMLTPRIRELDGLLRRDKAARTTIRESHPELAFSFASGAPATWYKKHPLGFLERLTLMNDLMPEAEEFLKGACSRYTAKTLACDDVVDALMLALTARASGGALLSLPENPQEDQVGLPMAIWYHDFETPPDDAA